MNEPPLPCPRSATHAAVAWSGVLAMLGCVTVLNFYPGTLSLAQLALIVIAASALGVFVPDVLWQRVHLRALGEAKAGSWSRTLTKGLGLLGSVGFVALAYVLFPEYAHGAEFYGHYGSALKILLPLWAVAALPYLYWVDRRLAQPRDALWQLGRCLLLRFPGVSGRVVGQHLLGWTVKGFFLPLMFTYFCRDLDTLLHYDLRRLTGFIAYYDWAYGFLYFVDVAMVSMTYLMSLRLTDTHIRSTEPTVFGWAVALACYEPFWSTVGRQYLAYDNGIGWLHWLGQWPLVYVPWALAILALLAVYVWATVSFGARFSNLTHRGIITNGPYRYSKHPAYLAKNLSWWLLSMPFMLSVGWQDSLRRCVLLLLVNALYYLRAKTEERHLSLDPVYRRYAQWIDTRGALRGLQRIPGIAAIASWRPSFSAYASPAAFGEDR